MTRLALRVTALLVFVWIVVSAVLLRIWPPSQFLRAMAVWLDIPLAVWLLVVGGRAYRRRA
jgi:hypothetical protein